jgi:hypothetical protein
MNLNKLKLEQIVEEFDNIRYQQEELDAKKKVLAEELLSRMKNDSELVGNYIVTKVKRYKFDMDLNKARDLGIVKIEEKIDQAKAKQLFFKGVEIVHIVTMYPLVKLQEEI